jgi:GNAT superfamily N-acetyltransferase
VPELSIARTEHGGDVDWAAIASIYEASFPLSEREDFDYIFRDDRGQLVWTSSIDGDLVGFAVLVELGETGSALLEYIAVGDAQRSRGTGRLLLDTIAADVAERVQHIVLEVEQPAASPDASLSERRLGFYRRWGAAEVACLRSYFMPDFTSVDGRVPMILMDRPHRPELPILAGDALRAVLTAIYDAEYASVRDRSFLDDLLAEVVC